MRALARGATCKKREGEDRRPSSSSFHGTPLTKASALRLPAGRGGYMHSSLYFFRPVASIVYGGSQFFRGGGGDVTLGFGGAFVVT